MPSRLFCSRWLRLPVNEYEQMLLSRYTIAQHRQAQGLDRSVYLLISRIAEQGPMSIGELSASFRLYYSTLQRQTTGALREGLLKRTPDSAGSVARKFTLTDLGKARLEEVREHSVRASDRIRADWPADDVNAFADLLHRFNVAIEEYGATKVH